MRLKFRRLAMGLKTILGLRQQGFFIPYRYAHAIPPVDQRVGMKALGKLFQKQESTFCQVLKNIQSHAPDFEKIGLETPPQPRWHQDWFPRLDAMAAYAFVRHHKPKRIIEIGSGHSTRFFARANRDAQLNVDITAIDPAPRADISKLGVTIIQKTVQGAGLEPFSDLKSGDILSIDSSHILMPGSDVDFLFTVVLPSLPGGVIVHIHDMFLPESYPASWEWRGYNEQLAVATLLQGHGYKILWSSHYVLTHMENAVQDTPIIGQIHRPNGAFESSLWLCKT